MSKYRNYNSILLEETIGMPDTKLESELHLVSLVTGKPISKLEQLSLTDFNILLENLSSYAVLNESDSIVDSNGVTWTFDFDFGSSSVKQFVDTEIIRNLFPYPESIHKIIAILMYNETQKVYSTKEIIEASEREISMEAKLYRLQKMKELNHFAKNEIPINYKLESNYNALLKLPIAWVWDKINRYKDQHGEFLKNFPVIFSISESNETEQDSPNFSIQENLYSLLMLSVDGNYKDINEILEHSSADWLTACSYKIQQMKNELERQKKLTK